MLDATLTNKYVCFDNTLSTYQLLSESGEVSIEQMNKYVDTLSNVFDEHFQILVFLSRKQVGNKLIPSTVYK